MNKEKIVLRKVLEILTDNQMKATLGGLCGECSLKCHNDAHTAWVWKCPNGLEQAISMCETHSTEGYSIISCSGPTSCVD